MQRPLVSLLFWGVFALAQLPSVPDLGAESVRIFDIDTNSSRIVVRLFRQGLFSVFSHDHLITAKGFGGLIRLHEDEIEKSTLSLSIPVESLEADLPQDRKQEGITGVLDDEERASVHQTMLSEPHLDGTNYPRVVITTHQVEGEIPALKFVLNVRIKNNERQIELPANVMIEDGVLSATGDLRLLQSDFGVEPFSDWMGTLALDDEILIRFAIVAVERQ